MVSAGCCPALIYIIWKGWPGRVVAPSSIVARGVDPRSILLTGRCFTLRRLGGEIPHLHISIWSGRGVSSSSIQWGVQWPRPCILCAGGKAALSFLGAGRATTHRFLREGHEAVPRTFYFKIITCIQKRE